MPHQPDTSSSASDRLHPEQRGDSLDDLPPPGTQRWVGRRKAAVVAAVRDGRLTLEGACERYGLSVEELMGWQRLLDQGGPPALRSTRLQQYRPANRRGRRPVSSRTRATLPDGPESAE